MAEERARQPTTFWADRWQFARESMTQRLPSPFRTFLTDGLVLTLSFILGGLLFGASFILDEAKEFVAGLLALALILLASPFVFLFYLLKAPPAMWRRDKDKIAQLRASLTPALHLTFDAQCLRYVPRGRVTQSLGGNRFHDGSGSDRHLLIKCVNRSKATANGVKARMVHLNAPPPDQDASRFTEFFHAVQLREFGSDADTIILAPEAETFFRVLVQPTEFDPPRPNERETRYHYEFLFTRVGTYEITIEAHAEGTGIASAILVLKLQKEWFSDGMGHKHPRYEITSVRQKDVD